MITIRSFFVLSINLPYFRLAPNLEAHEVLDASKIGEQSLSYFELDGTNAFPCATSHNEHWLPSQA